MARSDQEWNGIYKHMDAGTCYVCGKPVKTGSAIYGLTGAHYDCEVGTGRAYEAAVIRIEDALANLGVVAQRPRVPEGKGKVAKKAIAKAVAAIEKETGAKLTGVLFWNQKGNFRGPKWDLARWGLQFSMQLPNGNIVRGSSHSWATVTMCANLPLQAHEERDSLYSYNVEPQ